MKKIHLLLVLVITTVSGWTQSPVLPYKTGNWNPDTPGNQRVVVRVDKSVPAMSCEIP